MIWRPGFSAPATVVQAGTVLQIVSRQGNWYEVIVPSGDPDVRVSGFVAVSQIDLLGGAPPERRASPPGAPGTPQAVPGRRPVRKAPPGFRVYGLVEREAMTASQSFDAVLGSSSLKMFGGGVEELNFWRHMFARVAVSFASETGSRVFIDSSKKVFPLGIPVKIELTPVEIGAGWRFLPQNPKTIAVPYIGAALLVQRYKETSSFAESGDDVNTTDTGAAIFGGVELSAHLLKIAVEGQFRALPNALGTSGVAKAFSETNLGGAVLRVTFGVGF